jgi:allophanate hydrolase
MRTVRSCGDDLLSIELGLAEVAQAFAEQLRATGDWMEVVPGIDSVVVQFDATVRTIEAASRQIAAELAKGYSAKALTDVLLEIPVVYGGEFGPDFDAVCEQTGLSAEELIALHTGQEYVVDLVGFTPGFVYVGGLDDTLRIPRRKQPRQRVEAGSVGIADGRTGLYALAGPGGWPLIGRTTFTLFDPQAKDPFPLRAGMRIRFIAVTAAEAGL